MVMHALTVAAAGLTFWGLSALLRKAPPGVRLTLAIGIPLLFLLALLHG